ncbi:MAG: ankyrin repeat domain-containing protein [Planctomycetota bacterium]
MDFDSLVEEDALVDGDEFLDLVEEGNLESVRAAVDSDPGLIESRSTEGDSALHVACWQKHIDIAAFLVNQGADINARGHQGQTPLHYAVYEGDTESSQLVEILLEAGADVHAKDGLLEQNAMALAVRQHLDELDESIRLLEEAGSKPDLEVALWRNDPELARRAVADGIDMTRQRVQKILDVGKQELQSANRFAASHMSADIFPDPIRLNEVLEVISGWLESAG